MRGILDALRSLFMPGWRHRAKRDDKCRRDQDRIISDIKAKEDELRQKRNEVEEFLTRVRG